MKISRIVRAVGLSAFCCLVGAWTAGTHSSGCFTTSGAPCSFGNALSPATVVFAKPSGINAAVFAINPAGKLLANLYARAVNASLNQLSQLNPSSPSFEKGALGLLGMGLLALASVVRRLAPK